MATQATIRPMLHQAYLVGLMMMAVGLTLSPFLMGLSQFWLALVWMADGFVDDKAFPRQGSGHGIGFHPHFKEKWSRFTHNKVAVLLALFYLMHVVGLLYTSDFQYAMKDLRVKLPILVLPFIMSSMPPLDRKRFDLVLYVYVLSVFVATLFSFSTYVRHDYEDVREISHFISHIRFCLNIVFCIAIICYYAYQRGLSPAHRLEKTSILEHLLQLLMLCWFVYQIYIFESLSGYVILAAVVVVTAVCAFLQWKKGRGWRIAMALTALAVVAVGAIAIVKETRPLLNVKPVDFSTLDKKTALGNDYWHDTIYNPVEDGKFVGLYYCRKELQETWAQRSAMPLDDPTLEATLARYLTSKGLRKDAEGVNALSDEDIRNIEQGVANYNNWLHPGLRARLSSTLFEYGLYRRYDNPNGGSLSQRIEYTRASFHIIRRHWLVGVGTGDVPQAFSQAYDEIRSPLKEEFRFRAHNQYLAIAVAFGVLGLAFFLFVLFHPCCSSKKSRTYLYVVFLCIMVLSMFPEDTLETQAGASMFAFFEALFLIAAPHGALLSPSSGQKNKK